MPQPQLETKRPCSFPCLVAFGLFILGIIGYGVFRYHNPIPARPTAAQTTQELRERVLDKGLEEKVFWKTTKDEFWIGPVFYDINIDEKTAFVSAAYGFYYEGKFVADYGREVKLLDWRDGKEVGSYSPSKGLVLKDLPH